MARNVAWRLCPAGIRDAGSMKHHVSCTWLILGLAQVASVSNENFMIAEWKCSGAWVVSREPLVHGSFQAEPRQPSNRQYPQCSVCPCRAFAQHCHVEVSVITHTRCTWGGRPAMKRSRHTQLDSVLFLHSLVNELACRDVEHEYFVTFPSFGSVRVEMLSCWVLFLLQWVEHARWGVAFCLKGCHARHGDGMYQLARSRLNMIGLRHLHNVALCALQ